MNKQFKDMIVMFIGICLNMIIGAITIPIITRMVLPAEYGQASLLQTYINILVTVCLLGLDQAYVRFYYTEDSYIFRAYLSRRVLKISLIVSLLISSAVIIGIYFISELSLLTSLLVGLNVVIAVVETYTRLSLRLEQNSTAYSITLIVKRIINVITIILFLSYFNMSAVNSILLAMFFSLLAVVLAALHLLPNVWRFGKIPVSNIISGKELLLYSYPFIFSSLAHWLFTAGDKIVLQFQSNLNEIGYYSAASNIVALITIVQTTFTTLWVPQAIQKFEKNNKEELFFIKSNEAVSLIMIVLGATLILFKDVIAIILGGDYENAKYIFPFLLLSPIMFTISETTVYGINFYKKTQWHIVITSISCIFNLALNFILVPSLGSKGAAIATGISYIIFFLLRTYISKMYFKVRFNIKKFFIILPLFLFYLFYNTFFESATIMIELYILLILIALFVYRESFSTIIKIIKENSINLIHFKSK
ncbi:oligosaccharide flippase family protein [Aerococcus sp. UMB7834]|uniref:lipopolysaccharide biosynthesis protein n=1 Tax=Aerococcus sp. UMB7834 TaxID=3046342 RepID=UPI00254BABEB|nr:oligosaccharide flippase family protein [Aerococcus sp. UMB7834]MDK6805098.1 oligosaccharide flippase family protein [Aerococcus sp. UMB7834]